MTTCALQSDSIRANTTVAELFLRSVELNADRTCLSDGTGVLTYAELYEKVQSVAAWLQDRGLREGERVAVLLPNSFDYVALYFGVQLARGIFVGLNPETSRDDLLQTVGHCEASIVVLDRRSESHYLAAAADLPCVRRVILASARHEMDLPSAHSLQDVVTFGYRTPILPAGSPDEVAQIVYTSGTTSRPKGVTLSHRNLCANTISIIEYLELSADDSVFVILPFYYSYGNSLLLTHLAAGGRLAIAPNFVFWNRALDQMQREHVSGFAGVPSSYAMLLNKSDFERRSFPALRYVTCAGGALPTSSVSRLRTAFPGVQIYLMYGQTEATARLSTLMPEDVERKPQSIGRGIPGVRLTVLNELGQPVRPGETGEIHASGDNVMRGYWRDDEQTSQVLGPNGLRTGDLATVDREGDIYIVGRSTDIIKVGSYRISPREIEDVLLELDGIAEVAVVGLPDDILGEVPVAYIVRGSGTGKPCEKTVLGFCQDRMPRYKCVRSVHFVDALPKTASGKIRRGALHEFCAAASANCGD